MRCPANPSGYFASRPEFIRLVVTMHIRFPLSLHYVADPLLGRDIDICHGAVR